MLSIIGLALGFFCGVGFLASPVAAVLGWVALRAIRREPTRWSGEGMAIAGIVMGLVGTLVAVAFVAFVAVMLYPIFATF